MSLAQLGVCYYPEHWPEADWPRQAALMVEAGISRVRIAEFAWSRIEPSPGAYDWAWLDRAVATLADAGLGIVMCTPTACPPRWLVDQYPEILAVDERGRVREFGSRRHYRFTSARYRELARRISSEVIERYAEHPAVVGWQLDNEYGCHDTTRSFAEGDREAFQSWLAVKYPSIDALNDAWGTVFWSQEYADFSEIGLPNQTVTEANPAHRMDYRRFASDHVVAFNQEQAALLRQSAGADRWLTHNFMGNYTGFDHYRVAEDLDVATWDSYPLGFLDQGWASDTEKLRYRRIGHPDWAAFHHDLYHAVGRGRFGVMEQQPGPVNWAPSNAEPIASAPAFWAMEAIAHGAELVSFFRFQQLPRAQEQMHAALRLSDGSPAPAWPVVKTLAEQLPALGDAERCQASVALLFDYESCWATEIQPHANGMSTLEHAMRVYSAARSLGVDVDIVSPAASLEGYRLLLVPGSVFIDDALVDRIAAVGCKALVCPRSGSRARDFALPGNLAPGPLQRLLPLRVVAVDSMRTGASHAFQFGAGSWQISHWRETLETELVPRTRCDDGTGFWYSHDGHHYLNGATASEFIAVVLEAMCAETGIDTQPMPEGLRRRQRGALTFVFNFSPEPRHWEEAGKTLLQGSATLETGQWSVWREPA